MVDRWKEKTKLISYYLLTNRNDTLYYRIKNKKIRQRKWIFFIREKSIQQIWEKTRLDAEKRFPKM